MSNIEWTQKTWNPIAGCSKVSAGCTHCYAETMAGRLEAMGQEKYKGLTVLQGSHRVWSGKIAFDEHALLEPLRRKKPTTYFVNSMSDLFHENVTDDMIVHIFAVMALSPQHTYQVLTKREKRMNKLLADPRFIGLLADKIELLRTDEPRRAVGPLPHLDGGELWYPLHNVWLGVSVENQQSADERIRLLLDTPAAVRFISAEPLLDAIDLTRIDWVAEMERIYSREAAKKTEHSPMFSEMAESIRQCKWEEGRAWRNVLTGAWYDGWDGDDNPESSHRTLDWVIVGGESGHGSRPCNVEWIRSIVQQCAAAGVPCFVKQLGTLAVGPTITPGFDEKLIKLRDRKGGDPLEWPEDLRVRQMPAVSRASAKA